MAEVRGVGVDLKVLQCCILEIGVWELYHDDQPRSILECTTVLIGRGTILLPRTRRRSEINVWTPRTSFVHPRVLLLSYISRKETALANHSNSTWNRLFSHPITAMPLLMQTGKPRVILGLMTFGPDSSAGARITSLDEYNRSLDYLQSQGYNEVDTARSYIGGRVRPEKALLRLKYKTWLSPT